MVADFLISAFFFYIQKSNNEISREGGKGFILGPLITGPRFEQRILILGNPGAI